jgi:hypothetical protein
MGLPAMSIMKQEAGFSLECRHECLCTYISKIRSNSLAAKYASRPDFDDCYQPFTHDATNKGMSWVHGIGFEIIAASSVAPLPLLLLSGAGH